MEIKDLREKLWAGQLTRRELLKSAGVLGIGMAGAGVLGQYAEGAPNAIVEPAVEKKYRMAYSAVGMAGNWVARGADTMKFVGDLVGIDVQVYDAEWSVDKQRKNTEDIAGQDWSFVCIHPNAIEAFVDPVQQMIKRGIPVVDLDTKLTADLSKLDIVTFIEPDNIYMGSSVTQKLVDAIGGKGEVVHTQGLLTHTGAQGRAKGFHMIVDKYPDIKVVDETPGDWDLNKVRRLWEDLIVKFPNIVGGFFHNDDMAMSAVPAIKAAGKQDQVKLAGVDGAPFALKAVLDGTFVATVSNPSSRIHGGATWIGYFIASGKYKKEDIPKFIRADGPAVDKLTAPGFLWLTDNLML